jgi:hypothetical protein
MVKRKSPFITPDAVNMERPNGPKTVPSTCKHRCKDKMKCTHPCCKPQIVSEEDDSDKESANESNESDSDKEEQKGKDTGTTKKKLFQRSGNSTIFMRQKVKDFQQLQTTMDPEEITTFFRKAATFSQFGDYSTCIEALSTNVNDYNAQSIIANYLPEDDDPVPVETFNQTCKDLYKLWLGKQCTPYLTLQENFCRLPKRKRGTTLAEYAKDVQAKLDLIDWCRGIFGVSDVPQWRLPLLTSWVKGLNCKAAANTTTDLPLNAKFRDYLERINAFLRLNSLDPEETRHGRLNHVHEERLNNIAQTDHTGEQQTSSELLNVVQKCDDMMEKLTNMQNELDKKNSFNATQTEPCAKCPYPRNLSHTTDTCRAQDHQQVGNRRFQSKFNGECYRCGRQGHKKPDCRAQPCRTCGSFQHRFCSDRTREKWQPYNRRQSDRPRYSDRRNDRRNADRRDRRPKND